MTIVKKIKALESLADGINPTIIYNEGWMVRLLVMQSVEQGVIIEGVNFKGLKWTSEAKIKSPFMGPELKNKPPKPLNETHTQMDIVVGDFDVNFEKTEKTSEITVFSKANILGIIEAKMGSDLSTRITNAENYNQISRSICCLAYNVPKSCSTFVMIVAPKSQLENSKKKNNIKDLISKTDKEIKTRLEKTNNGNIEDINSFNEKVKKCKVITISFEDWIKEITDSSVKTEMEKFYKNCKKYNKIKN